MQMVLVVFVLVSLLVPQITFAQQPRIGDRDALQRIVSATSDDRRPLSEVRTIDRERWASQSNVPKRSWASRHPVLTGTLIGLAGGAAVGVVATNGCNQDPACEISAMTLLPAIGSGVGAIIGRVISRQ